jgi:hypothetical protein
MMNKRIKELLVEAGIVQPGRFDAVDGTNQLEKFAELIVRECARAVDKVYEDAEPDHSCYDWATWAAGGDVLKHFEIEE